MSETNFVKSKRLFIGINAGSGIESEMLSTVKKLKISADKKEFSLRWTPKENWHVTVLFLGEVLEEKMIPLESAICKVCDQTPRFQLKVHDLGGFPTQQEARVIWAGVQRSKSLLQLHQDLARELGTILPGIAPQVDYSPHLTLGRLKNPKSIGDLISPFIRKKFGKMEVAHLTLFESILLTPFPVYKPLRSFQLTEPLEQESIV